MNSDLAKGFTPNDCHHHFIWWMAWLVETVYFQ